VIDRLCDQASEHNATVACFYFDFAAGEEQSPTNVLSAVLKQVVWGLGKIPEEISLAYQGQSNAIGGRGPQLADVVRMLQNTASAKPTFICIDALDECAAGYQVKLLDLLSQILLLSPGTRIFITGRPHIRAEVRKRLSKRVMTMCITTRRHDIIHYLHTRLDEDTTPDAMDPGLKANIMKRIPEDISEMWVEATILHQLH